MNKKIILKVVLLIIVVLLAICIIHTVRNFIIISDIQNKVIKYTDSNNYHVKIVINKNNETIVETDFYKKDDRKVSFLQRERLGEKVKLSIYDNNGVTHAYTETKDGITLNSTSGILQIYIGNVVETYNIWQKIIASIMSDIKIVTENGKEYYSLRHTFLPNVLSTDDSILIDKETGLIYKNISENSISRREYEFNNVDDSIFIEPNISE